MNAVKLLFTLVRSVQTPKQALAFAAIALALVAVAYYIPPATLPQS